MMKEKRERKTDKGKKNRTQEKAETEMDELNIHCMDYTVQELEFTMVSMVCFGLCHNTLTPARTPRLGLCHNTLTPARTPRLH